MPQAPLPRTATIRVAYFAMEYVPGAKSITRYAAENGLAVRERLGLFLQACDAVQYGHTKGVIHRDLKPGNILVGEEGPGDQGTRGAGNRGIEGSGDGASLRRAPDPPIPRSLLKVIDFGVAKSTDSDVAVTTMRTDLGQIIGTLQYMSPEQAGGAGVSLASSADIDTRSDVYSLGVVLYELLTERLPYDVSNLTLHSAMRRICEQAPTPPSRALHPNHGLCPSRGLQAVLRRKGDLETIILKALEKAREKRYQSAADLAADIRRYLNGEPIDARPPTRWTRAVRWAGRHPVATTAAVCACFVTTTVVATYSLVWFLNQQPYRLEVIEDSKTARLISFAGRELKRWQAQHVWTAGIAELPGKGGTHRLGIIGFIDGRDVPFPNSLCAYDVDRNLEQPVWERHVETSELHPYLREERKFTGEQYAVGECKLIDIFPEEPGEEIVTYFNLTGPAHPCIRIYSLDGRLLYQIWHDGALSGLLCYWIKDAGLLVFAGVNSEALSWSDRGVDVPSQAYPYPQVVFAIRPVKGAIRSEYVYQDAQGPSEDTAWYKCLMPEEDAYEAHSYLSLETPPAGRDRGRTVLVKASRGGRSWTRSTPGYVLERLQRSRRGGGEQVYMHHSKERPSRLPGGGVPGFTGIYHL